MGDNMKKIIFLAATVVLLSSQFAAAMFVTPASMSEHQLLSTAIHSEEFPHTVFVEEGTTTWCPNCPMAAEALYALYNSGETPFYFMALVIDMNKVAQNRFSIQYRGMAIPTVFFDGGYKQQVGTATTQQQTEQLYKSLIQECAERTVRPLELTSTVIGHDDATLDIAVTVKNTGNRFYFGMLRSAVTEKISRWNNQAGNPYHFGFLDYAIRRIVVLLPQQSKTFSITWDGTAPNTNQSFADIVDDNILVISTVAHWRPNIVQKEQYIGTHLAFYIDQTTAATVE